MARVSIDDQLEQLERLAASREEAAAQVASAVEHRHYRVAARGAQLATELSLYELCRPLAAAYGRFLAKPAKQDPSCLAKSAIARALVQLDHDDADFYRAGLRYRQPEPVWGGTVDTAVDVRLSAEIERRADAALAAKLERAWRGSSRAP